MIITVTAEDIARGKPNYSTSCPIALALKRKFGNDKFVQVDCDMATIDDEIYRATKHMSRFIDDYDEGKTVWPTKFRLIHF